VRPVAALYIGHKKTAGAGAARKIESDDEDRSILVAESHQVYLHDFG